MPPYKQTEKIIGKSREKVIPMFYATGVLTAKNNYNKKKVMTKILLGQVLPDA